MTDWTAEYRRDPSLVDQLMGIDPYGQYPKVYVTDEIRKVLKEVLEPIVAQIQEYPISEDEIKRMGAEIRSLYE